MRVSVAVGREASGLDPNPAPTLYSVELVLTSLCLWCVFCSFTELKVQGVML